jgi:hypothetical protein
MRFIMSLESDKRPVLPDAMLPLNDESPRTTVRLRSPETVYPEMGFG